MLKTMTVLGFLLLAGASPALAGTFGANLAWDACGASGTAYKTLACNTDVGSAELVVSFATPNTFTDVFGVTVIIDVEDLVHYPRELPPPWWNLQDGGCRSGALSCSYRWDGDVDCASHGAALSDTAFRFTMDEFSKVGGMEAGVHFNPPHHAATGGRVFRIPLQGELPEDRWSGLLWWMRPTDHFDGWRSTGSV